MVDLVGYMFVIPSETTAGERASFCHGGRSKVRTAHQSNTCRCLFCSGQTSTAQRSPAAGTVNLGRGEQRTARDRETGGGGDGGGAVVVLAVVVVVLVLVVLVLVVVF